MLTNKWLSSLAVVLMIVGLGACDTVGVQGEEDESAAFDIASKVTLVNGWYEGEEIYYIDRGVEEGVTELGENDIYLIGGNRVYQPQVVEFIPGEAGYSPHWNVYVVHTADGVTVADIVASPYVSEHWNDDSLLFDDVDDLRAAEAAGLVTFEEPGVVVLCPIIPEPEADGMGISHASEDFLAFPDTF